MDDSADVDAEFMRLTRLADFAHLLWTDCYLTALARYRSCRIVSFDTDFNRFPNLDFLHLPT